MIFPRRPLGPWAWFAIFALALTALVLWLASGAGRLPDDRVSGAQMVQGVLLAALIGAGLVQGRRIGFRGAAGAALAWLAVGAALVLAYSYRYQAQDAWRRITGEIVPDQVHAGAGRLTVRRAADGHFYMRARVDGVEVRFLIDTGAGETVLDPRDAVRIGLDPARLRFTQSFQTANGIVRGAPVMLRSFEVGPLHLTNVRASVNAVPLGTSLLGVSTLGRFLRWHVANDTLTLEY